MISSFIRTIKVKKHPSKQNSKEKVLMVVESLESSEQREAIKVENKPK